MHSVTKTFQDLPAAHRQHNHKGHCAQIHGHNWRFDISFTCDQLDENGFVIDVGALGSVKKFLVDHFDHTLLLNADDPELDNLMESVGKYSAIRIVTNCGMELLAKLVFTSANEILQTEFEGDTVIRGLQVLRVVCFEDSKNQAVYDLSHP